MTTLATRLAHAALLVLTLGTFGCEIVTNIDRSLIPVDGGNTTGTTSGTTTTTGAGGGDGGGSCTSPGDCPGTDTECQARTCTSGACGVTYSPDGTALETQPAGTCQKKVCDGSGGTQSIPDDANIPVDDNHCTDDVCSNGVPSNPAFPAGTACSDQGGKVCDGAAHCVACVKASDCGAGACVQNKCVAATCTDGIKDGTETDVDCGGSCPACLDGGNCGQASDCQSKVCTTGKCAPGGCNDSVQNGSETDVDCGGSCPACGPGLKCAGNGDCKGGACAGGTCQPTCTDGVKDGTESDVDCGGTCSPCATGKVCTANADCATSACDANTKKCDASQCADAQKDGVETDVDCGGSTCFTCGVGKHCGVDADCASDFCNGGTCTSAPVCADHQKDGAETDVDCGGGVCPACAVGKACVVNGDCASNACDANTKKCDPSQCVDAQKDGTETDVDCGGSCPAACATGKHCSVNADCQSVVCVGGTCASGPSCTDGQKDGTETGTDCGGSCPKCGDNLGCAGPSDCQSGSCVGGLCHAPTCLDGVQNGSETGVDCGGPSCPLCPTVVVVGASSSASFGAELHPTSGSDGTWSATTSLGAPSVSDLGLTFIGAGASTHAVGVMRYTQVGDPLDQAVVYTTWTLGGSWTPFAAIASGVTTREVPSITSAGTSAFVGFQGLDFNLYFASFDGAAWAPSAEAVGIGGVPTPPGIAAVSGNATIAYFDGSNDATAQDRIGTWQSATTLDTAAADQSYVATPAILAPSGGSAELLAAFIRQSDGAVMFSTRTSGVWSPVAQVPGASAPASGSYGPVERLGLATLSLPGGSNGAVVLAWRDATTSGLFYSFYVSGAWSAAPTAFSTPNITLSAAPALAHGVAGSFAEMAFVESDGVAYHTRYVGGAWTTPVAVGGSTLSHVTIASAP